MANILFSFLKQMIQREADVKSKVTAVAFDRLCSQCVASRSWSKRFAEWMREVR